MVEIEECQIRNTTERALLCDPVVLLRKSEARPPRHRSLSISNGTQQQQQSHEIKIFIYNKNKIQVVIESLIRDQIGPFPTAAAGRYREIANN